MKYRPEIDGMRAFAVVPVILFHAGFELFSGGYVGVDVFFVISGYLITTIIVNEMEQGKFSLANFYERRARRILPALIFIVLACVPFAWMWLSLVDMKEFSRSMIAVATFSSNITFWLKTGYFDTAAELKPLLHTWSLAVEEQYYILFPLFLIAVWRFGKRAIIATLVAIFVVSLGVAHWAAYNYPSAAFYLLPTRGWELLLGAFCAFYLNAKGAPQNRFSNTLSMVGLALIAVAFFMFDGTTPTPSLYTLVPTLGTVLLILFANAGTLANWILSSKIMVGLGLISYSTYLWHQPILVFIRKHPLIEYNMLYASMAIALTFVLATLTWRFVEMPFRNKKMLSSRSAIASFSAIALFVPFVIGMIGYHTKGLPLRFYNVENYDSIIGVSKDWKDTSPCVAQENDSLDAEVKRLMDLCYEAGNTFYLIGDSHAASLSKPFRAFLSERGVHLISLMGNGCFPIEGTTRNPPQKDCVKFTNALRGILKKHPGDIILSSRWRINLSGARFDNGEGGIEYGPSAMNYVIDDEQANIVEFTGGKLNELADTYNVYIIDQIPEAGWNVPEKMLLLSNVQKNRPPITTSFEVYQQSNASVINLFEQLDQHHNINVINTSDIVCTESNRCLNELDGVPLYRDDDHPSKLYAALIAEKLKEIVFKGR